MKRLTIPRMRRAVSYSVILHVVGCLIFVIGTPWKRRPAPLMEEIPIYLVSFSPPPSRVLTARPPAADRKPAKPDPEPPEQTPKPKPPAEKRNVRPVPVQETADQEPDPTPASPSAAAADTTSGLRGTIAVPGGGEGEMVIGADGPISAYTYYLQVVRDKIARFWVPPAGLISNGHEVASIVNFRIDRRGRITGSYVEEPSGTSVFDQAGLRAVAQADPLPPLPQDYEGDWLGIHLRFVYRD